MVLLINNSDHVKSVLTMKDCMEALEDAYRENALGWTVNHRRTHLHMTVSKPDRLYRFKTMPGGLEIQQAPIPKLDPGSLLVKIIASTLCGTDMHRWHGPLGEGDTLPIITGHEPCGYVEDVANDCTEGRGADIVVQVANNSAVPEGLTMLRDGGRFVHIGVGGNADISANRLPQEMTFYTVRSGEPRHWLQDIDFLASRKRTFPFDEMISKSYKLEQINDAMETMARYEVVKPVIYFQ